MASRSLISLFITISFRSVICDILCEHGFCRKFLLDNQCPPSAQECTINNATHYGLQLPSPTLCNCCHYCLPLIAEGDHCSIGGPGLGTTIGRCSHGLTCVREKGDSEAYCKRMQTACHKAQDDFDTRHSKGETWVLEERPLCDEKGLFATFSCVPTQTCFCQSEAGERIFGEVLYTGATVKQNMHCGCSRFHEKIKKNISPAVQYPVVGPRCTADGNFNPIQCIDRICYCVNRITGVILEGDRRNVNISEKPLTDLECYSRDYDLFPHQSTGLPPYNYTTPCLENIKERIELLHESEEAGYNVNYASSVPECLPDGTFGRVAVTVNRTKICVDDRGRHIENFEAALDTPEYDAMNCKCAQTLTLMAKSPERPVCCKNGNFRKIQCRRGLCRCVDGDGRQTARETRDVKTLPCYTEDWRTC
ncbi:hypothetical protein ACJJTC_010992 [Scirpophaga incertulas]